MDDEQILGKYRLIEPLGRGGFSVVYRAENLSLGTEVALKILNPTLAEDETFAHRFRREARRTALLDHPNIVRVLDLDQAGGQFFLAMEYIPSQDLRHLLAGGDLLPLELVVNYVRQLAAALDYAHGRGLIHRDVKPGNVLVREDGILKLTDFGLVKAAEGSALTQTGTTLGTPAYMSPEQTRGTEVDGRSDLYALGVMAYEFVTGRVPFQGDTPVTVAYMHVHEIPPLPSSISPRAEGPIEPVLIKALAKDPSERYQTGAALANALAAAVYDVGDESLGVTYDQAITLLEMRRYDEALGQLETIQAVEPEFRDVETLIMKAEEGQKLSELYMEANQHLASARELATQIASSDPDYPDTAKVLQIISEQNLDDEDKDALAKLFDEGLSATLRKRWMRATRSLDEVVRQRPEYTRSGQRAADLLAEAQKQLSAVRRNLLATLLRRIGNALVVLFIATLIFAAVHLLFFRPLIEETIFDLVKPTLASVVEPESFGSRSRKCLNLNEAGIGASLEKSLRLAGIRTPVEARLERGTIQAGFEIGGMTAAFGGKPVVIEEDGITELTEFRINWLIQILFSPNGLRRFIEGYINDNVLRGGEMWLDEITIRDNDLVICVTPR